MPVSPNKSPQPARVARRFPAAIPTICYSITLLTKFYQESMKLETLEWVCNLPWLVILILFLCTYSNVPCTSYMLSMCLVCTCCQCALYVHTVNVPCMRTLSMCLVRTCSQCALCVHAVKVPCMCTLSMCLVCVCCVCAVCTCCQCALYVHAVNVLCVYMLSMCLVYACCQCALCVHAVYVPCMYTLSMHASMEGGMRRLTTNMRE